MPNCQSTAKITDMSPAEFYIICVCACVSMHSCVNITINVKQMLQVRLPCGATTLITLCCHNPVIEPMYFKE